MAATHRHEQELKQKSAEAAKTCKDPVERLRLSCLSRGASGIKGLGRSVLLANLKILLISCVVLLRSKGDGWMEFDGFLKAVYRLIV